MAKLPIPKTPEQWAQLQDAIKACWELHARPNQLTPLGDWDIWLIMSGRGWGKTRTAVQQVIRWARDNPGCIIHLVARTAADVRDTMVEGESGILACSSVEFMPKWEPSKRRITWPNGSQATTFSAEEPDALRGPQCHFYWADELASWKYVTDTWDNLQFGARLGAHVQGIITTTPRPIPKLKELVLASKTGTPWKVHITRGNTYDNAKNLAPSFLASIKAAYEGSRLGRQEIEGQILDDNPRALWRREWIESSRTAKAPEKLSRIVVAIDPAGSDSESADKTGIVVCASDWAGNYYVIDDATMTGTPLQWGTAAVALYHRHKAGKLIAEKNYGGQMVEHVIKSIDEHAPVKLVTATRGKAVRAEPVSTKAEQGKIHHVGCFPLLEDELCEWDPTDKNAASPNRLDALVWGITDLMGGDAFVGGGYDVSP